MLAYVPEIPCISHELLSGVFRATVTAHRNRRLAFVEAVLDGFPVVSFDLTVARVHARLVAELLAAGRPIGSNDAAIAATAVAKNYTLMTINVRHFTHIPDLLVHDPWR